MSVAPHAVFKNVFSSIYNLINNNVSDPLSRTKWIYSSFPDEDVAKGKVNYPIIIIKPAEITDQNPLTITKNVWSIEFAISVYSSNMSQADDLLGDCTSIIDQHSLELKNDDGLNFIKITSTDTDSDFRGGLKVHVRSVTHSTEYAYSRGLTKNTKNNTVTSDAVIS